MGNEDGTCELERRSKTMTKRFAILMVWIMLSSFSAGCAEVSKEAKVKCPKCGAVFKIHEGRYTGGDKQ